MKRACWSLLAVALSVIALSAFPAKPDRLFVDLSHQVSANDAAMLEAKLRAYEARTSNEFAVVIVPSLEGQTVEAYAERLFREWGIGKKGRDNGLLFLWSTSDRRVRFEVGYGLEGVLPDGRAGDIIRQNITPAFKEQRWLDGLIGGIDAAIAQLDRQPEPAPIAEPSSVPTWAIVGVLFFGVGVVLVVAIVVVRRANKEEAARRERQREADWRRIEAQRLYQIQAVLPRARQERQVAPIVSARSRRRNDDRPSYTPPASSLSSDSGGGSSGGGFDFGGGSSGGGGASGSY